MTTPLRPDDVHRTALLAAHDGSQPTLEAALAALTRTGIVICADTSTCRDGSGQAALLTAVVTARRAFGTVTVLAGAPGAVITTGMFRNQTLASAIAGQGGQLIPVPGLAGSGDGWPVLLLGPCTPLPAFRNPGQPPVTLRASWTRWTAQVSASAAPERGSSPTTCVLAAIAAAALGVSEAFEAMRALPGSDAGFRDIALNLWSPGGDPADSGPDLTHAPCAWWLVGLGHLGQACGWVISWLPYADASAIELILQDTGRTTPANYSTGVLTPEGSDGAFKTRLVAAALDAQGFGTRIIERRASSDLRAAPAECHVALLGVDNLPARRLTSAIGWTLAVDIGLGDRRETFSSMLIRRFPGAQRSEDIAAWRSRPENAASIPASPAFADLQARHDQCGVTELAGKAVGASFVGIAAACLAVAETIRELHGGPRHDCLMLSLATMNWHAALAGPSASIVSAPLRPAPGAVASEEAR